MTVSEKQFKAMMIAGLDSLPGEHVQAIQNIAIVWQPEPTPEQIIQLELRHDQTLLGLYEGIPLPSRQGNTSIMPDKITLFKGPLERHCQTLPELKEQIRHTLWHEIGHYYGLNHDQIGRLEN